MTTPNSPPASSAPPIIRTAFISGPVDIDPSYFTTYYISRIDRAIFRGDNFVLGCIEGIDSLALAYLLSPPSPIPPVAPARITVYIASHEFHTRRAPLVRKLGVKGIRAVDGGATDQEKDARMTRESDYDVLRYRTEREAKEVYGRGWWRRVSNTEMNERRRRGGGAEGVRRYVKHVDEKEAGKWKGRVLKGLGMGEEDEVCDGLCDGHRMEESARLRR